MGHITYLRKGKTKHRASVKTQTQLQELCKSSWKAA